MQLYSDNFEIDVKYKIFFYLFRQIIIVNNLAKMTCICWKINHNYCC